MNKQFILDQVKPQALNEEVLRWINHNLNNYLNKNNVELGEVEHIIDFLNSEEAPKRLIKMSYEEALSGATSWVEKLRRQAENVIETEEDTTTVLTFENGFRLVKLVGKNAFLREGKLMSHCVGSYYEKTATTIYSLRDYKNNPHATFEVSGDQFNQVKGKGNGEIHPNYIHYVIKSLEHFGMKIRESEVVNLGYENLPTEVWAFLESCFDGVKYITFSGQRFFYKGSILKKKENAETFAKGLL